MSLTNIGLLFFEHLSEVVVGVFNVEFGGEASERFKFLVACANDFNLWQITPCVAVCVRDTAAPDDCHSVFFRHNFTLESLAVRGYKPLLQLN